MHSRLQPRLECYVWNLSIPLINWDAVTADLKRCGGKNSLNATLNGRSHYNKSPEPLIWALFEHSPSENYLSVSLLPIFVTLPLCLTLSLRAKPHTNHFVQPLVLLHYCTVQHYSIKWIIWEHLWPSTGLSLAMNQEELKRNDDGHRPLWKLAEWSDKTVKQSIQHRLEQKGRDTARLKSSLGNTKNCATTTRENQESAQCDHLGRGQMGPLVLF